LWEGISIVHIVTARIWNTFFKISERANLLTNGEFEEPAFGDNGKLAETTGPN
jgi:hypothetical protein